MKRRELVRHLEEFGCVLHREGASHAIYTQPATGHKEAVPRHTEIKKHLARSICRNLGVPVPKGG
jgi:predicted RNA binding protein YcfA (HicA-like mRNA interferase family)